MAAGSHFECPKITLYRIYYHFRSIPQFLFCDFFCKMAAGGHFGWSKITFGRISGHFRSIRKFVFKFLQNGRRCPFWMSENHFRSHFWPFQINTKLFLIFVYKMAAVGHLYVRNSLWITFLAILDQYRFLFIFFIFYKMAAGGHFGCPKITFDRISDYFRSIRNFYF